MDIIEQAEQHLAAITPGEWETHVFYSRAAVKNDVWGKHLPELPIGQCSLCHHPGATLVSTEKHEDGGEYHTHRYLEEEPNTSFMNDMGYDPDELAENKASYISRHATWRTVYSNTGAKIIGGYDYEEGGVASSQADAEFIAAAPALVRGLLAEIQRLRRAP